MDQHRSHSEHGRLLSGTLEAAGLSGRERAFHHHPPDEGIDLPTSLPPFPLAREQVNESEDHPQHIDPRAEPTPPDHTQLRSTGTMVVDLGTPQEGCTALCCHPRSGQEGIV